MPCLKGKAATKLRLAAASWKYHLSYGSSKFLKGMPNILCDFSQILHDGNWFIFKNTFQAKYNTSKGWIGATASSCGLHSSWILEFILHILISKTQGPLLGSEDTALRDRLK